MKKVLVVCSLLILAMCFTGCEQVIEMTDAENYMVAEYAAELLLKYDRKDHSKYDPDSIETGESDTEEVTTEEFVEDTTEVVTEATTEVAEVTTEAQSTETPNNTTAGVSQEETVTETVTATVDKKFDIAAFVGEDRISCRYSYYMLVDSYPSYDQDGMFIEIEAPSGYKLLVLKFDIENKTNDKQDIDLYSKDVTYRIIVDNSKSTKQMFTILIDDLYTFQKTIDESSREEVVLLYTVSDSVAQSFKDLKLKVEYGGTNAVLQLD